MYQLQNPWMAMQDQQMPVMMNGVPYVENMPREMDGSYSMQSSAPAMVPDKQYNALMKRLEDKTLQGITDQRKSVDKLREYQGKLGAEEAKFDLTPLLRLSDQWTGSNMAQGYQAPETRAQKEARVMGVEQQIANQNAKITDDELGLLRTQLASQTANMRYGQGSNGKDLSATAILKVNEGNAIPALLKQVEQTIDANQDYLGYAASLAGTEVGRFTSPENYEKSKTIDSQMRASSQAFGKYMEGGVLRKEDEEKYRKMFPQLSDTPQVAKNKLAIVQSMMTAKQQSDLDALKAQGYNINGLQMQGGVQPLPGALTGQGGSKKPSFEEWKKSKGF
jgi:hypothetical protein